MGDTTTSELNTLLVQLGNGDATARERLLLLTQERLRRLASRMLHGGFTRLEPFEQSDDVMQTMLLRLMHDWDTVVKGPNGHPVTDVGVFLGRATRLLRQTLIELVRRHYGRAGNRPRQVSLDAPEGEARPDPGSDTLDPEPLAYLTEFHNAVDSLPDHLRQVVELHWYDDLTHQDTAAVMGIGESTVKKYWVAARMQLIQKLGSNPFERYRD